MRGILPCARLCSYISLACRGVDLRCHALMVTVGNEPRERECLRGPSCARVIPSRIVQLWITAVPPTYDRGGVPAAGPPNCESRERAIAWLFRASGHIWPFCSIYSS